MFSCRTVSSPNTIRAGEIETTIITIQKDSGRDFQLQSIPCLTHIQTSKPAPPLIKEPRVFKTTNVLNYDDMMIIRWMAIMIQDV